MVSHGLVYLRQKPRKHRKMQRCYLEIFSILALLLLVVQGDILDSETPDDGNTGTIFDSNNNDVKTQPETVNIFEEANTNGPFSQKNVLISPPSEGIVDDNVNDNNNNNNGAVINQDSIVDFTKHKSEASSQDKVVDHDNSADVGQENIFAVTNFENKANPSPATDSAVEETEHDGLHSTQHPVLQSEEASLNAYDLADEEEDKDWYHNSENVNDDSDGEEDEEYNLRKADDQVDDDLFGDTADASDGEDIDQAFWDRFENGRKDEETKQKDKDADKAEQDYNEKILEGLIDEEEMIKNSKPPTAPSNMVLFYTWMILAMLVMVIGVSTYQARCKGLLSIGGRQQTREDRKRLLDNEFV